MKKNKTGLAIAGLLVICMALAAGVFTLGQPPKGEDAVLASGDTMKEVNPSDITSPAVPSDAPNIEPDAIPSPTVDVQPIPLTPQGTDSGGQTGSDIPLTVIEDRPEPPELPDTAYTGEPEGNATPADVEEHEALDPALKDPDTKPDTVIVPPVEPDKPAGNTPQSGDHNGNGEVYIPGFGWVKDEGGGSHGEQSQLDPEHADFDKIIGY